MGIKGNQDCIVCIFPFEIDRSFHYIYEKSEHLRRNVLLFFFIEEDFINIFIFAIKRTYLFIYVCAPHIPLNQDNIFSVTTHILNKLAITHKVLVLIVMSLMINVDITHISHEEGTMELI